MLRRTTSPSQPLCGPWQHLNPIPFQTGNLLCATGSSGKGVISTCNYRDKVAAHSCRLETSSAAILSPYTEKTSTVFSWWGARRIRPLADAWGCSQRSGGSRGTWRVTIPLEKSFWPLESLMAPLAKASPMRGGRPVIRGWLPGTGRP